MSPFKAIVWVNRGTRRYTVVRVGVGSDNTPMWETERGTQRRTAILDTQENRDLLWAWGKAFNAEEDRARAEHVRLAAMLRAIPSCAPPTLGVTS